MLSLFNERLTAMVSTQISAETNDDSRKQIRRVETPEAMDVPDSETTLKLETAGEESHGEESQMESTESETEQEETLMERYLRIKNTPEFKAEWSARCEPIWDELVLLWREQDTLRGEEKILKERLTDAEGKDWRGIEGKMKVAVQVVYGKE